MTAKICEITAYSENNSPAKTFRTLNFYLSSIIQSILDEAGMIDKIIGDTVISWFGILPSTGYGAKQAVTAAFHILESIQDLNLSGQSGKTLDIAISITSGIVALGLVGNKASKTFLAIGYPMDLLTQLGNEVKSREILIDENTFSKISDMQKYFLKSIVINSPTSAPIRTYSYRIK